MNRILISILFILSSCVFIFLYKTSSSYYKVTDVITPTEIFLDLNKNLIFDEEKPFVIKNIFYIDENNDYSDDEILKDLTFEEKVYLSNEAERLAFGLIKNRFITLKNNEIYIRGNNYRNLLLNSRVFYSDDHDSKLILYNYVKSLNIDDYVIYNYRTEKVHKLSCAKGRNGKKFVIVKKADIKNEYKECPFCLGSQKRIKRFQNKNIYPQKDVNVFEKVTDNNKMVAEKTKSVYKSDNIKVWFIDLNEIEKPSSSCNNSACKDLKNLIDSATQTIDFAIYGIDRQPEIADALLNAQKRGVKLRWVIDFDKKEENYYKDTIWLKKRIINHITDEEYDKNNRSAIMHNKFFIFDGKKVWTGSANISNTDLSGFNSNLTVLVESPELASVYTDEFNQMYSGIFHTQKNKINKNYIRVNKQTDILPLFSPADKIMDKYIIKEISSAKSYIYIPIFFITYNGLIEPLIAAHKRGVDIKIIDDATNSHNKYSIHKKLREAGIKVKTENYAGKMHMKTMITDDKTSIIGSMNFTKSGTLRNDENVLIIKDAVLAKYLKSVFLYLWNKIPDKYEKFDPPAESRYSIGSCFDGVDNDFDGKIDSMDEGCFDAK